jgi:2-deoxy-D-gluconate 3-dehydrogenase
MPQRDAPPNGRSITARAVGLVKNLQKTASPCKVYRAEESRDMFDLKGRVAIVTGGNGGIGLGMARGLAGAGAHIVVAARDAGKSRTAVQDLAARGVEAHAVATDVTDEGAVGRLVEATLQRFGRLDVLVNNAGINVRKPVHELALEEWRRVLDTNLTSAFLCSRAAYPAFKTAGGGKIINIGSMMSIFGASFAPVYSASKGGIVQLTKSTAVAWARDNIQVNAVLPGWIDTELTQNARREVPELNENILRRTPAGRWGGIDDMAGVAVFLASRASDFVTGAVIPVDGGYSIQG